MRLPILAAVLGISLLALPSASGTARAADTPKPAAKGDEATLRGLVEQHVARFNQADWKAIQTEYTDDALMMHQYTKDAAGPDSIAGLFRDDFRDIAASKAKFNLSARVDELQMMGSWAFCRGVYTFTADDGSGNTRTQDVRFLDLYRKQADGGWKIARSMDNSHKWPYQQ